jgi:hypothetical protein
MTTAAVMEATIFRLGLTGLGSLQLDWRGLHFHGPCEKARHSLSSYQTNMVLGLVEQGTGLVLYGGVKQDPLAAADPAFTWSFNGPGWASSNSYEASRIVTRHYQDLRVRGKAGELGEEERLRAIAFEQNLLGFEGIALGLDFWGVYKFAGVVTGSGETVSFPAITPNRAVGSLANFGYPAVMAASSIAIDGPYKAAQWGLLTAFLVGPFVMVGLYPDASWRSLPSWAQGDWIFGTGVNLIAAGLTVAHGTSPNGFGSDYVKYAHGAIAARHSATLKPFANYTTPDGAEWLWGPELWSPTAGGDPALGDQRAQAFLLVANNTFNAFSLGGMFVTYKDPFERLATGAALALQLGIPQTKVEKQIFASNVVGALAGGLTQYLSNKSAAKKKASPTGVTLTPTLTTTPTEVVAGLQGQF